mmetsp:Transcript_21330/g.71763  ORF Transcript_21330/g.71763 Transcript_21330/m.71763 type:complete len:307 (+) Transcript_21330:187-1107(+)
MRRTSPRSLARGTSPESSGGHPLAAGGQRHGPQRKGGRAHQSTRRRSEVRRARRDPRAQARQQSAREVCECPSIHARLRARADGEGQAVHTEVLLDYAHHLRLVLRRLGHELGAAVPLGSHALAAVNVRAERGVREHAVQYRRGELRRARGRGELVKERLRMSHELPEALAVPGGERLDGLRGDLVVARAEELPHALGDGRVPEYARVALVEVAKDDHRVLVRAQLHDDEVQGAAEGQRRGGQPVTVELHEHRLQAKGAALVHPAALGWRGDFSLVREVHLAPRSEAEAVHGAEGARDKHTDRGRG